MHQIGRKILVSLIYGHCEEAMSNQQTKEYNKNWKKQLRINCKAKGLCIDCPVANKQPALPNKLRCQTCTDRMAEITKKWYLDTKIEVFNKYGNECICCGESNLKFLTIDHINQDGAEHRKQDPSSVTLYRWLKKHNYPDGFQVMCFNCNMGRNINGGICPHKDTNEAK